jgi:hypothetical protein
MGQTALLPMILDQYPAALLSNAEAMPVENGLFITAA